ncbi:RNA-directed DNA polymerase, eukaryota, reverse transcriptase zinc-binding domain protein [Tanacetum coccineum]
MTIRSKRSARIPLRFSDYVLTMNNRKNKQKEGVMETDVDNSTGSDLEFHDTFDDGDKSNGRSGEVCNEKGGEFYANEKEFPLLNKSHVDGDSSNVKGSCDGDGSDSLHKKNRRCDGEEDNQGQGMKKNVHCSFTDVTKANQCNVDNTLSLVPMCMVFDEELVREGSRKWELTLCGHFVGCKMSYTELRNRDPSVVIDKRDPEVLPCWIKLYNVPLEAWTVKGISAIASEVGKPLIMDKTTSKLCKFGTGNFGYARVLVEIKAENELKEKVELCYQSKEQKTLCFKFVKVEYSWKPPMCSKCKVFGHTDSTCGMRTEGISMNGSKEGQTEKNERGGFRRERFGYKANFVGIGGGNKATQDAKAKATRQEFRPITKKTNDTNITQTPLNTSKETVEELRRSANKFAVLENYEESSDPEDVFDELTGMAKNMSENEVNGMIATWNVRGLCNRDMQKQVKKFISDEGLSICAVLETHVKDKKIKKVCEFAYGRWNWVTNIDKCDKGCRIGVGWNEEEVNLMVIHSSKQSFLCLVEIKESKSKFFCCFVYASNSGKERRNMWRDLGKYKRIIDDKPWALMGDWNECMEKIEVEDLNCSGIHFTWVQSRQDPSSGILKKIDRVLGNTEFMSKFINSHVVFLPHLTSDHSPAILYLPKIMRNKKKAFRFSNFVADKPEFLNVVQEKWIIDIEGCHMFKLVKKLKALKVHLKKLSWKYGNIYENVVKGKEKLQEIQGRIDKEPHNSALKQMEAEILRDYNIARQDEEKMFFQRAKIKWLSDGDKNSKYFHTVLKGRAHKSKIEVVKNENGDKFEGIHSINMDNLKSKTICDKDAEEMIRRISDKEIKEALYDICDNKAPRPDGYTAKFYKKAWDVV